MSQPATWAAGETPTPCPFPSWEVRAVCRRLWAEVRMRRRLVQIVDGDWTPSDVRAAVVLTLEET